MKRKIIGIFVCSLLITTILPITGTVIAGDEDDPEITDSERDIVGPLEFSVLPNVLYPIFHNIDILSGWFHENPEDPSVLLVSLKVHVLTFRSLLNTYVVWWRYNDVDYFALFNTHTNGGFQVAAAGYFDETGEYGETVAFSLDHNKNIITFTVPKTVIGNPGPGDVLEYPWIWTAARFQNQFLSRLYSGELGKDYTNPGRSYVIQY